MPRGKQKQSKPEREPSVVTQDVTEGGVIITEKRRIMADAILTGATLSEAARMADMHPSSAGVALRDDDVKAYLAKAREEVEELSTLKRIDVLNLFVEAIDMARTLADPANMINGADKIAKMMGYYAPETRRIEISDDAKVLSNQLRNMSDADLIELAARRAKVIEGEVVAKG